MTGFEMTINGMMSEMEKPFRASHRLAPTNTNTPVPYSTWRPYPEYKDSGVGWLWEIPAHWEAVAIKRITGIPVTDGPHETPEILDEGIPFISAEAIKNDKIDFVKKRGFISAQDHARFSRKYSPQRGDIFLIKSGATTGNVAFVDTDEEFNIWSPLAAIRPDRKKALTSFVFFFMKSRNFFQSIELGWNYGTQQNIGMNVIENIPIALPTLLEQSAIATFLNRETAKIDALIAKKERQIELLQEKRTALISRAVTKGLDPTAPMKDSGVEWLGEIPKHWGVLSLKRRAIIRYGLGQPPAESSEGVPLIRATNISRGIITEEKLMYVDPSDVPDSRGAELLPGEIIVVRSGAYTGDSAIVPDMLVGAIAGYDMVVTVQRGSPPFIAWQLLSSEICDLQFGFYKLRAAQPHINAEELGKTLFTFPPSSEQTEIAAFIDQETTKIDALIGKIREGIDKLKEYRTALISAAVTGKIDVREARSI